MQLNIAFSMLSKRVEISLIKFISAKIAFPIGMFSPPTPLLCKVGIVYSLPFPAQQANNDKVICIEFVANGYNFLTLLLYSHRNIYYHLSSHNRTIFLLEMEDTTTF